MTGMYAVSASIACALFAYLIVALLWPERLT